jgi:SpoIID/LytB domain protein
MAAYLFRLSDPGANDPGCSIKPYPDVPTSSTFCGDINWLTTKHVTKGYPDGNFHPNVSVARQEMAAFLHRLPGITFTFHGHGWGHGIGMSQWGAEGQALAGRNATKILNFYYPGTGGANIGNPRLRVQLRYMGGGPTVVRWSNGLRVYDMTPGHKHASVKLPKCPAKADTCGGLWAAQTYPTKNGPRMRLTYQTVADTAEVETYHFSGVLGPLRFGYGSATKWQAGTYVTVLPDHLSGNSARVYGGLIDATPVKGKCGKSACPMATVAQVPMEEYLRGVVPYEAIDSWKPAALQAQAVAARTYAEQARGNASYDHTHLAGQPHPWDICDTTACQVYDGNGLDGKTNSDAAIRATAGWIRTYDEHPISAMFSASNGGWTVQDPYGAPAPYLPAKKDPYDAAGGHNPWTKWSKKVSASMFAKHVPGHGRLVSLQITGRDGHGDWGGRVTTVALHFADGHTKTVSGGTIRGWAGLRSTWFTF